ncbi:MAG TPA: GNAT family N-acetyltransferase [Actinomycetota bacterium]|nr:GNAT family N-acetyltransferase [Actinomycetota bacterium]
MTDPAPLAGRYRSIAFDLDGTIYLESEVVPAAPATLRGVRELGIRVGFVTNNAMRQPTAVVEALSRLGIKATVEEVQTSSQAAVRLLGGEAGLRGKGVLVIGGRGLREALSRAGARLLEPEAWRSAEIVVAGLDTELTYEKLRAASLAIAAGSRYVGSNADASLPTPQGPWPGAGSVLALLETATGKRPEIAGKPQPAMFETVAAALGPGPRLMVGDRVDTDLAGAQPLGWATALVLTGVTRPRALLDVQMVPDHLLADVGGLLEPPGPEIRAEEGSSGLRAVAERDGAPVGWLACRWDGSNGSVDELWVEPEWRGRLVATRLLLAATPRFRAAGVRSLTARPVHVQAPSRSGAHRGPAAPGQPAEPRHRVDPAGARRFLERLGFKGDEVLSRDLVPGPR